jgi:hypothetical protein
VRFDSTQLSLKDTAWSTSSSPAEALGAANPPAPRELLVAPSLGLIDCSGQSTPCIDWPCDISSE